MKPFSFGVIVFLLSVFSFQSFANLKGQNVMISEIQADASQGFKNVLGKQWILVEDSLTCMNVSVYPTKAFEIIQVQQNIFNVKLISSQALLTSFGELLPLSVGVTPCDQNTPPQPPSDSSELLGVEFKSSTGSLISIDRLQRDPQVHHLAIVPMPSKYATLVRIDQTHAYFKRNLGYGTEPITVFLNFDYQGNSYQYQASLPMRDDGFAWKVETLSDTDLFLDVFCHSSPCYSVTSHHVTQDLAFEEQKNRFYFELYSVCDRFFQTHNINFTTQTQERKYLHHFYGWNPQYSFENYTDCFRYTDRDGDEMVRCSTELSRYSPVIQCRVTYELKTLYKK